MLLNTDKAWMNLGRSLTKDKKEKAMTNYKFANFNRLLEMVKDGSLDTYDVFIMCINYMSEKEIADMMERNNIKIWKAVSDDS